MNLFISVIFMFIPTVEVLLKNVVIEIVLGTIRYGTLQSLSINLITTISFFFFYFAENNDSLIQATY